jgi:hypothetical protein
MILKTIYRLCGTLILSGIFSNSNAQQTVEPTKVNDFYSFITLSIFDSTYKNTKLDGLKYTSLKIEVQKPFENPILIAFKNTNGSLNSLSTYFSENADEGFDGTFSCPLQIFDTPQTELNINWGDFKGFVKIELFHAPKLELVSANKNFKTSDRCSKPQMISYSEWRSGLPDPKPPREATEVEHLVVHHSAGSNTDTNYLNTIRNIYLFHTQSNGWDDIGYNFLVAPNGVVFNGRDPKGVADDDNILGAHFCGKNQNTMGVCMLGDFMKVRPTEKAIFSLKYLLAWKLKKDGISAFGQTKHPQNTGSLLNNLCGHRDGCNTDCPGDSLHALLPSIKAEAARIADSCGLVLATKNIKQKEKTIIFPNPTSGELTINSNSRLLIPLIEIYDLTGNQVYKSSFVSGKTFYLTLKSGFYFYKIKQNDTSFIHGKLNIEN